RLDAQFAPSDRSVLVGVEADGNIEVAERDVPLTHGSSVLADLDPKVAIRGKMGVGCAASCRERETQNHPAQHQMRPKRRAQNSASIISPTAAIQLAPVRRAIWPHSASRRRAASRQ